MGSDGNCKCLPMLSLSYVKVCFPLVSDCIKLQRCGKPAACVSQYSSLIPVCYVWLYLRPASRSLCVLLYSCCPSWQLVVVLLSVVAFVNIVIKNYYLHREP